MTTTKALPKKERKKTLTTLKEHIVEIISDSGEGAQRCGQSFGAIAARMGTAVKTVDSHKPPAGTQRRRCQRQPHPYRLELHHQRR